MKRFEPVVDEYKPSCILVVGDVNSTLACAIVAKKAGVPVAHVEAGLRSGNIYHPWPEEVNRKIIGTIASLHFAPTDVSAGALIAEQVDPARVHVTGNTVIDALHWVGQRIAADPSLASGLDELKARFAGKRIIGVTSHRRENFGGGMRAIANAIKRLAQRGDVALVFPVHLNPNVQKPVHEILANLPNVHLIPPLEYEPFLYLLKHCYLVLTDSGGIQEEAPSLGKPVLVMRDVTERPEAVDAGTVRLVGANKTQIVENIIELIDDPQVYVRMSRAHNPYGDGQACRKIVQILKGVS